MPLERREWVTRDMLRQEREKLFVFGDNLARWGRAGQALAMRGEPNAIGLPTKRSPNEYMLDEDRATVEATVRLDVLRMVDLLKAGGVVVWPKDGIGTGLAHLEERAPSVARFYEELLKLLEDL